jgi:hypothetical protein
VIIFAGVLYKCLLVSIIKLWDCKLFNINLKAEGLILSLGLLLTIPAPKIITTSHFGNL